VVNSTVLPKFGAADSSAFTLNKSRPSKSSLNCEVQWLTSSPTRFLFKDLLGANIKPRSLGVASHTTAIGALVKTFEGK